MYNYLYADINRILNKHETQFSIPDQNVFRCLHKISYLFGISNLFD